MSRAETSSFAHPVQSGPSKSERFFFNSLIFTLSHRRPRMSQFDTIVKTINLMALLFIINIFLSENHFFVRYCQNLKIFYVNRF
jgi:hypothetical protein